MGFFSKLNANYAPAKHTLYDMVACGYYGISVQNQLDHDFPSHLTDRTTHSFSDLPFSSLLLLFTCTMFSKSNSLSPFYSLGQKYFESNFPFSHFTLGKLFYVQFLFPLRSSWTKNTKFKYKFHKNILRQFLFLS